MFYINQESFVSVSITNDVAIVIRVNLFTLCNKVFCRLLVSREQ